MDTKSKKEIVAKAWDKVAPIAEKEKNATKAVIENIAVLTTMITIGAYVVMYAYKAGYYVTIHSFASQRNCRQRNQLPAVQSSRRV